MVAIKQFGQFIGPADLIDAMARAVPLARKVRSWDNSHSPATRKAVQALMAERHAATESVFDAAHGRRYLCFLYRDQAERKACWAFHAFFSERDK